MGESIKVRENRARRAASRQGLELHKSRVRDPRAIAYERWYIADGDRVIVAGGHGPGGYDLTLEDVERYLDQGPHR